MRNLSRLKTVNYLTSENDYGSASTPPRGSEVSEPTKRTQRAQLYHAEDGKTSKYLVDKFNVYKFIAPQQSDKPINQ